MIKSKNICKNMYESIFTNKKIFNKMFLKSGISYEDIEGKSIKEIIKLFQTTFNCIDDNLSIKVEPISKDVEERIFNELEKTEEVKGGTNIRKDGITSSIDEDLLLGNISSCHINGDEITRTEKDKTLLYMKFIKNEIERVIPHSTSIKMVINISGQPHYIVFSHKTHPLIKSIIALYRDTELTDELLHITFFENSFTHLTFIRSEDTIKKAYRLYYVSNPDYQKGLIDILLILNEIKSQIFKRRANIKSKFWCNNQTNNWMSLVDTTNKKNHLKDDIKDELEINLTKLIFIIWKLDFSEIITPPIDIIELSPS